MVAYCDLQFGKHSPSNRSPGDRRRKRRLRWEKLAEKEDRQLMRGAIVISEYTFYTGDLTVGRLFKMCANRRNHVGGDLTWVDATPPSFYPPSFSRYSPTMFHPFPSLLFCPQFNEEVTGSTKLISFPQYSVKKWQPVAKDGRDQIHLVPRSPKLEGPIGWLRL